MGTLLIAAYVYELVLNDGKYEESLVTGACLKKFLTEVVPIVVYHQVTKVLMDFVKEELNDLA